DTCRGENAVAGYAFDHADDFPGRLVLWLDCSARRSPEVLVARLALSDPLARPGRGAGTDCASTVVWPGACRSGTGSACPHLPMVRWDSHRRNCDLRHLSIGAANGLAAIPLHRWRCCFCRAGVPDLPLRLDGRVYQL